MSELTIVACGQLQPWVWEGLEQLLAAMYGTSVEFGPFRLEIFSKASRAATQLLRELAANASRVVLIDENVAVHSAARQPAS